MLASGERGSQPAGSRLAEELFAPQGLCSTELNWLVGYSKVNMQFELETCSSRYISTLRAYPCNWSEVEKF